MSVKEMDALHNSSCEGDQTSICEPIQFRNSSHTVKLFEVLQSLRKDEVLCDIRLKTDDGTVIFGHKVVLISASPYFRAMFSTFGESNTVLVNIREFDSAVLQLLVDYIYTGKITVTDKNVEVLLPAANILQLDYVSDACAVYLQTYLDTSNCFGIKEFAEFHSCTELLKSSDEFIKKQFLEVVKGDEFLSLSSQELIKLISCNYLAVPFEEEVFECVIKWVKFELDHRKDFLPELMEHVRLPLLASTPDILKKVLDEPLLKSSPDCKCYVDEVFQFSLLKSLLHLPTPQTIRSKPRQSGGLKKVILMFNESDTWPKCCTEWYDPTTKLRKLAPDMKSSRKTAGLGVIRDQFVFVVGGVNESSSPSVNMLDLYSRSACWVPMPDMLVSREHLGVGVLDDYLYVVGGYDGVHSCLNSAEVFDAGIQKWRMVSSMSTIRCNLGVGALNNRLYAVGGYDGSIRLKSVECYDPTIDTWTPVEEMSVSRQGVGVGVLNGIMYAVGGYNGDTDLKSVEIFKPNDGVWCPIADMHLNRYAPGVVALDGLLYVFGGNNGSIKLDSLEIYNPNTNTWILEPFSRKGIHIYGGVVVNRPFHFTTN